MFSTSSKSRLTAHDLPRFAGDSLFDRIGRAVCHAGCLPRKELYEAWEIARRVRRVCRGGRVVDMAGGHGLLAHVMLLLDDSSPEAVVVDTAVPASAAALHAAIVAAWPRLASRVTYMTAGLDRVPLASDDIVVSSHACGALTDVVIGLALAARVPVAVLPCCHDRASCETGPLTGWVDESMAIDAMRAVRVERQDYRVLTQTIPSAITPKNRLLIAIPNR